MQTNLFFAALQVVIVVVVVWGWVGWLFSFFKGIDISGKNAPSLFLFLLFKSFLILWSLDNPVD